ncbi:MAG: tetratricopeptide repeat protein [Terriglobia bacterium]
MGGRLVVAVVFVGVWSSATAAQETPPPAASVQLQAGTPSAISAESQRKLRAAFEHLYSLGFESAGALFEQVAAEEPESATVRAFWASALLYEILAHQGTLQSQLFVTSNEFLRRRRLSPEPELDQRFHRVNQEARQRAEARLEKNPHDIDGLFALGLVYGTQANYLAGVKAEYFRGLRIGEKAYILHKRLRKLRPEVHDTAVVLGIRDYILGSLRLRQRFLLFFLGARGNRERGLKYLEEAATQGEFLRTYAQVLLVVAHIRAEQLKPALSLAEDLRARYPHNPIILVEVAKLYRRVQRYPEAARASHDLLAELIAHPHNPRLLGPEAALLELGLVEAAQSHLARALETLDRVGEIPDASPHVQAQALLERGKIFDRLGEREKALAEYEKVINLAVDIKFTRPALNYREQPYQADENK